MRNFRWLVVWVFAVLILGCGDDPIVNPEITPDENMPLPPIETATLKFT